MKLCRNLLTALLITLFAVSSVMAVEFSDNSSGTELNNESAIAYSFAGPYYISSIDRASDGSFFITFIGGSTFATSDATSKNLMSTALATNTAVYLYVSGTVVYGILLFKY